MAGSTDKCNRNAVHSWLLLAASSLYLLASSLAVVGIVAVLIVRRILLSPAIFVGWRYLHLFFAFCVAETGLIWAFAIALFCFRTRMRSTTIGNEPGFPLVRHDAPGVFRIADELAAELQLSNPLEFRADLGGGIVCPGLFIPGRKLYQTVVLGLPVLAVLTVPEFTEALRAQLRLAAISPRLRFRVAELHRRFMVAHERSGRISILFPVEYLCRHALQVLTAYAEDNAAGYSSIVDRIGTEFTRYLINHVNPLIATGHAPPLSEGFYRHWNFLDGVSPAATTALSLICNPGIFEERLANATLARTARIERVSWEQSSTVLLSSWLELGAHLPEQIRTLRCGDIAAADLVQLGRQIYDRPGRLYDRTQLRAQVCRDVAIALVAAISKAGWRFNYDGPGTKYQFSRDSHTLLPFSMANGLLQDDGVEVWQMICTEAGITDLQMG